MYVHLCIRGAVADALAARSRLTLGAACADLQLWSQRLLAANEEHKLCSACQKSWLTLKARSSNELHAAMHAVCPNSNRIPEEAHLGLWRQALMQGIFLLAHTCRTSTGIHL